MLWLGLGLGLGFVGLLSCT